MSFAGARAIINLAFRGAADVPVDASPSLLVVAFAVGASLVTGALFGAVPAIVGSRSALRAFNVSTTSATGYLSRGVPEGRNLAPANGEGCLQLKAGDCAPRATLVRAPWFARFDIGVTKRFPIRGSMNFEVRADVLNVFDNINFNPFNFTDLSATLNTAYSNASFGQVTAAYQDTNNTFDPGGRLGMLMFRFNW